MPGIAISFAPGIARAVAWPPRKGTSGSSRPWMTVAGTSSSRRPAVRSPEAMIAASWRPVPAGWWPRSYDSAATSRMRASSAGKPFEPISWNTRTKCST